MLIQISVYIWRHQATVTYLIKRLNPSLPDYIQLAGTFKKTHQNNFPAVQVTLTTDAVFFIQNKANEWKSCFVQTDSSAIRMVVINHCRNSVLLCIANYCPRPYDNIHMIDDLCSSWEVFYNNRSSSHCRNPSVMIPLITHIDKNVKLLSPPVIDEIIIDRFLRSDIQSKGRYGNT